MRWVTLHKMDADRDDLKKPGMDGVDDQARLVRFGSHSGAILKSCGAVPYNTLVSDTISVM